MKKFDLVDKGCFECDPFHAPFETIEAENRNKAKAKYNKIYSEYRYVDILCRNSRKNSFGTIL